MNSQIAFPELVTMIAEATSTTERVSELFVKELFATVSQALIEGKNVTIKGVGSFKLSAATRSGNEAYNRLVFEPDAKLAAAVNEPFAHFETITLSDAVTERDLAAIDDASDAPDEMSAPDAPDAPDEMSAPAVPVTPPPFNRPVEADEPSAPIAPANRADEPAAVEPPTPVERAFEPVVIDVEDRQEPDATHKTAHRWGLLGFVAGIACTLIVGLGGRYIYKAVEEHNAKEYKARMAAADEAIRNMVPKGERIVMTPVVLDTVTPTNYLSLIAQKHYGHQEYWIYIYQFNAQKIEDPNNVPPGTVVAIPKLNEFGINNPNDPASIAKAKKLTYDTFARKR